MTMSVALALGTGQTTIEKIMKGKTYEGLNSISS
jgi:hypothetical protein